MAKVLITGIAGYIGDSLVDWLKCCYDVYGVDNLMYTNAYMNPNVKFKKMDVTSKEFLEYIANEKFDVIVHLAAMVGDGACQAAPKYTAKLNHKAVENICSTILEKTPSTKLVFASTCSVYGAADDILNETSATSPMSLYADTKLAAEEFVRALPKHAIFRLGTLFGVSTPFARIRTDLVVNVMVSKAMNGEDIEVFGGEQWRPLVHVRDVGRFLAYASHDIDNGTFIMSSQNYKISDIAEKVKKLIPTCGNIKYVNIKFEDHRNYRVDNSKLNERNYRPVYTLDRGISEMLDFYSSRVDSLTKIDYHNALFVKEKLNGIK